MYGKNFVIRCNLQYAICLFYKLFYSSYPKSMFFSLLRHYTGGAHAPTQLTCILGSFFLGCLDKWAIIYLKPTVLGYLILVLMCILFAPISNHKICLTTKQKWIHKLISVIIVSIGFLLFYKIGNTKMNTTLFYSFFCVIILMIVETIKNLMRHFK